MGLYEYADLDSPDFIEGLIDFPEGVTFADAWSELGTGEYMRRIPKSTEFRDPLHRIIHRAIAHGIAGRGESAAGFVTKTDLFFLYCMVHHRPCQIAERLARYLFHVRSQKHTQAIFGGGFVSRLARSLGVEAPIQPGIPQFISSPVAIDIHVLANMKVVKRVGRRYVLATAAQPAAPQVEPRRNDHEAGGSGSGGGDQVHTDTPVPDSTIPVPPPPAQSAPQQAPTPPRIPFVERGPRLPIQHTFQRDHSHRIRRMEAMLALEFEHAEAHRHFVTRSLQLLAASQLSDITLPDPPVRPHELTDFIRLAHPTPDLDHPPPQP